MAHPLLRNKYLQIENTLKEIVMKSKIIIPALVLTILAGGTFAAHEASARGCPSGHGMYMENSNITDEQRTAARNLVEESQKVITPIKEKMFVKKQELEALKNASNPDVAAVTKTSNELVELRRQLREEKDKLGEAIDKALGLEPGTHKFGNQGYGKGHGGYGKGHGQGGGKMHNGGHGTGHDS